MNGLPGQQLCVSSQAVTVLQSRGLSALKEVREQNVEQRREKEEIKQKMGEEERVSGGFRY